MKEGNPQAGEKMPTHSESALFRDPYAVLAEIAANAKSEAPAPNSRGAQTAVALQSDEAESFSDPFTTVPRVPEPRAQAASPLGPSQDASAPAQSGAPNSPVLAEDHSEPEARKATIHSPLPPQPGKARRRPGPGASETAAEAARSNEGEKLKTEIVAALRQDVRTQDSPHIEVQNSDEGLLISLTDDLNYAMFAIGSAEPQPKTVEVMEKIGRILKTQTGSIVIRGHTDGRSYKSANYDNWRLSSARAHMAHYMLARGGLDEEQVEKVEGYADRRLKFPNEPVAAGNRRIEILLRREKP